MLPGMAGRVRVREIGDDEGNRLRRIVRRGTGSVGTWRRAQVVPWSAQGMSVAQITGLAFTSEDRVRVVLHNFNADGAPRPRLRATYTRTAYPALRTLGNQERRHSCHSIARRGGSACLRSWRSFWPPPC
jgi:hypothetical protein